MRTNELRRKPLACRGGDPVAALRKVPSSNAIALISISVAVLDQLTKWWAVNALDDRTIGIIWKLQFHLTSNTGFAFSTGQGLGTCSRGRCSWSGGRFMEDQGSIFGSAVNTGARIYFWGAPREIYLIELSGHLDGVVERSLILSTCTFGPSLTSLTQQS